MSIQRLSCFFNLCSSCSSRSNKHRRDCLLPPPAAGYAAAQASPPHRSPIAGLAIALLTHTCCYSPATADEPVNPRSVVLPSVWETTAESSLPPCRSLRRRGLGRERHGGWEDSTVVSHAEGSTTVRGFTGSSAVAGE